MVFKALRANYLAYPSALIILFLAINFIILLIQIIIICKGCHVKNIDFTDLSFRG
jgi:hypothetical protein